VNKYKEEAHLLLNFPSTSGSKLPEINRV